MPDWAAFLLIVGGIVLSVLVPVAVRILKPEPEGLGGFLKPYLKYAFAALVIGFLTLIVVKTTGGSFKAWYEPLLTGYFWDSTLQKIKEGL